MRRASKATLAAAMLVAVALPLAAAAATSTTARTTRTLHFRDLTITVRGEGQPVLMIPGLASGADVWDDTCTHLQPRVQCLMVGLPGFAGAPATRRERYLETVRDELLAFVASRGTGRVAIVGHSLGGVLALMMAAKSDRSIDRMVIVDALPFLPALQDPAASIASVTAEAARTRDALLAATPAQNDAQARSIFPHLVHDPARVDTLVEAWRASDRATLAQATYELMTTDLRDTLPRITRPVLVLGAWSGLAASGITRDAVETRFAQQFARLPGVQLAFSEKGYHFLMWDDPAWLDARLRAFLMH